MMGRMKPILFNTEMVRAILEGRKTVTRRIANISTEIHCGCSADEHDFVPDNFNHPEEKPTGFVCRRCGFGVAPPYCRVPCGESLFRPRYWPGDILYVRETWGNYSYDDPESNAAYFMYRADFPDGAKSYWYEPEHIHLCDFPRWRPSIHMPKEAARIFLRVTDVRVERLQDIDGEQAYMEGVRVDVPPILLAHENDPISLYPKDFEKFSEEKKADWCKSTARAIYIARCELSNALIKKFKQIWTSTIKPAELPFCGWEANPLVWVYKFEMISKEEVSGDG